jgi:hypothetical protein
MAGYSVKKVVSLLTEQSVGCQKAFMHEYIKKMPKEVKELNKDLLKKD